jgi:FkbM family methyltransferase
MRAAGPRRVSRWQAHGWLRPLQRGELQVLGGLGVRLRMSAAQFPFGGTQAFGVLAGVHEPMVQEALRRTAGPGAVVYDVGANIGATALLAARIVGPQGRVIAIEPQPECAAAVRASAQLNGFGWLDVVEAAAAASTGRAELIVVSDALWTRLAEVGDHGLEERRETVATIALDDLDAPPPDVVKIDVEGAELEVVAGMRRLLAEARPLVICEMHGKNERFARAMAEAGYRVVNLDGPEPVEHADGNVHVLCEPLA